MKDDFSNLRCSRGGRDLTEFSLNGPEAAPASQAPACVTEKPSALQARAAMESSENEQNTPKSDGTVVEMAQHAAQDGSRVDAAAAGSAEARAQAEADDDERAEKSVIQELEQEVPPGVGLAVAEEAVRGVSPARPLRGGLYPDSRWLTSVIHFSCH